MLLYFFFFFNDTATTEIYTLSLHDALPISEGDDEGRRHRLLGDDLALRRLGVVLADEGRSEEHTSELQSPCNLVCRLLLEKKKIKYLTTLSSDSWHHLNTRAYNAATYMPRS